MMRPLPLHAGHFFGCSASAYATLPDVVDVFTIGGGVAPLVLEYPTPHGVTSPRSR